MGEAVVDRRVVKADVSGQLSLLNDGVSGDSTMTKSRGELTFVERDPQHCQISLKDHLKHCGLTHVFLIDGLLREQDWSEFESVYKSGGRPPYAPRVIVGLILYGVMQGKSSLRDLEQLSRDSMGCMWITGGLMPDHSVIGRFIQQHGKLLQEGFFASLTLSVLKRTSGTVDRTAGDATIVEAAASRYKTIKREALKKR